MLSPSAFGRCKSLDVIYVYPPAASGHWTTLFGLLCLWLVWHRGDLQMSGRGSWEKREWVGQSMVLASEHPKKPLKYRQIAWLFHPKRASWVWRATAKPEPGMSFEPFACCRPLVSSLGLTLRAQQPPPAAWKDFA